MSRIQFDLKIDLPRAMGRAWKVPIGRCAYFLRLSKYGVSNRSDTPSMALRWISSGSSAP